jgi:hypothetical protein
VARGFDLATLHGTKRLGTGKIVITRWKSIIVVRKAPKKFMSGTARQIAQRNLLKELVSDWHNVLSQAQRDTWGSYAQSIHDINRWGNINDAVKGVIPKRKNIMSGFNAFLSLNIISNAVGLSIPIVTPPIGGVAVAPPLITSLTYDPLSSTVTVDWMNDYDPILSENIKWRIWACISNKAYSQVVYVFNSTIKHATFTQLYGKGGVLNNVSSYSPGNLRVQMEALYWSNGAIVKASVAGNTREISI